MGEYNRVIWYYQLSWWRRLATVKSFRADVSSVSFETLYDDQFTLLMQLILSNYLVQFWLANSSWCRAMSSKRHTRRQSFLSFHTVMTFILKICLDFGRWYSLRDRHHFFSVISGKRGYARGRATKAWRASHVHEWRHASLLAAVLSLALSSHSRRT